MALPLLRDHETARSIPEVSTSRDPGLASDPLLARAVRRGLDIVVSAAVLVGTAPLLLLIALAIRLDSPGSALFWQVRMTRRRRGGASVDFPGEPFRFVKFRTMRSDARRRFPHLYDYSNHGAVQNMKLDHQSDDPRLTRVGAWLRRSSLDELPNFWNVLRGNMTLVGPRPEVPEMSVYYDSTTLLKFQVKAGITGLAQVSGRGHLSFEDTIALDTAYVEQRSLATDVAILARTVSAVVLRRGAV